MKIKKKDLLKRIEVLENQITDLRNSSRIEATSVPPPTVQPIYTTTGDFPVPPYTQMMTGVLPNASSNEHPVRNNI